MPSPQAITPSTLPNGNPTNLNGVDSRHGDTVVANGNSVAMDREASMELNKEKARAIVASQGITSTNTNTKSPSPQSQSQPQSHPTQSQAQSPNGHTNGTTSRKRSRSGTRLPAQEDYTTDFLAKRKAIALERLVQHEQLHSMALIESDRRKDATLRDLRHQQVRYEQEERLRLTYPGLVYGIGYAGYGNGIQDVNFLEDTPRTAPTIVTLDRHRRPGGKMTPLLRIPRKEIAIQAEQIDELVPIRLDIEWDKVRLRDTFTWNIHDRTIDVTLFAHQLVEDMGLDPKACSPLVHQIVHNINEQLVDYHPHVFTVEEPLDSSLPYFAYKNDEMRILIKLHITIGRSTLMDQFEWDINYPANSPEEFAALMTKDLKLSGEFTTAIAHSIREQCQAFTKSLYAVGHPFDGRPVEDHEIQANLQPSPMAAPFRPHQVANGFTPVLFDMDEAAFEKSELNLSREERRQKRGVNRRGGPILPDLRDKRRTVRSLIVSSILPGAVATSEETRLFKRPTVSTRGRRAAVRDEFEESDESGSEASEVGEPTVPYNLLTGSARVKAMRDAETKAKAAKATRAVRSSTPDSTIPHHEPRSATRAIIRDDSSPETPSVIVRLKLSKSVVQQIRRGERARSKDGLVGTPGRPTSRQSSAAPGSMGPPMSTPRAANQGLPGTSTTPKPSGGPSTFGRVEATGSSGSENPPPPPRALVNALANLAKTYPEDRFDALMRYTAVSSETDQPIILKPDTPTPHGTKFFWYPRIKCKDCPGKLYTPDANLGVQNFEVHLKNRQHRGRVDARVSEGTG